MSTKVLLGRVKEGTGTYADGENLYLEKHKWECSWYWGFGYIGNNNCHFHFDSLLKLGSDKYLASEIFSSTNITDKEWWVIRDLFVQAYALKKCAEVYQYGGHQITQRGVTDIIKNDAKAKELNADLERVLDLLWSVVVNAVKVKEAA
jgi:hypothetical protein